MVSLDKTKTQERPEPPAPPVQNHTSRRRRLWRFAFTVLAVGGALAWYWLRPAAPATAAHAKAGAGERGSSAVPVVAARASRSAISVFINGLGVVTPIYTVTLKSRVDGQLMEVHYSEGQIVQKGDLLVEIDPRPYEVQLAQAEGQLAKDQAAMDNGKLDLARYQKLWSQNAIPQQQMATQQSLVTQFEATIQSDQAQIAAAKLSLTYCRITAPITGRVGLRLADPGNIVHAADNTGLVVITQLQPISVIFTIAEDQLPPVLQKMRAGAELSVEAWDRELKTKLAVGSLMTTDNEIDQSTGTLKLRAQFDNADHALFPGQFVNARLKVEQKSGVTVAPLAAIQRGAQSAFVYLIQPDRTVTVRAVTLGTADGDRTEIVSGLTPGDTVVTDGVDKLQEGSKVSESVGRPASPSGGRVR